MSKPTGRLRWMMVKLDEEKPHPVAIKLQVELFDPRTNIIVRAEDAFHLNPGTKRWWVDIPLVDGDGNEIADHLHIPAWKMD